MRRPLHLRLALHSRDFRCYVSCEVARKKFVCREEGARLGLILRDALLLSQSVLRSDAKFMYGNASATQVEMVSSNLPTHQLCS